MAEPVLPPPLEPRFRATLLERAATPCSFWRDEGPTSYCFECDHTHPDGCPYKYPDLPSSLVWWDEVARGVR